MVDSNQTDLEALRQRLDNSCDIEDMRNTEGWKIVEEIFKKIGEKSMRDLAYTDIKDVEKIIELQMITKMSRQLLQIVENLETDGKMAFDILEESGAFNKFK